MSRKLAWSEPLSPMAFLAGHSLRAIIKPAELSLFAEGTPDGDAVRQAHEKDAEFKAQWSPAFQNILGDDLNALLLPAARKQGLTAAQIFAYTSGQAAPSAAVKAKLTAMRKEVEAKERPLLAEWLSSSRIDRSLPHRFPTLIRIGVRRSSLG